MPLKFFTSFMSYQTRANSLTFFPNGLVDMNEKL